MFLFGWFLNQDDLTVKFIMPLAFLYFTSIQTTWIPEYSKGEVIISSFRLQEGKWKDVLVLQVQTASQVNSLKTFIEMMHIKKTPSFNSAAYYVFLNFLLNT